MGYGAWGVWYALTCMTTQSMRPSSLSSIWGHGGVWYAGASQSITGGTPAAYSGVGICSGKVWLYTNIQDFIFVVDVLLALSKRNDAAFGPCFA